MDELTIKSPNKDDSVQQSKESQSISGSHIFSALLRSAPLPSPSELGQYEKIQKGLANRIVIMAEEETLHRHIMDKTWMESCFKQQNRGQLFGLIIGLFTVAVGGMTAISGATIAGALIGSGGVVGLV